MGDLQITLGCRLHLVALIEVLLGIINVLVGKLDLITQPLLELLKVVLVGCFSCGCCIELCLDLLQKAVEAVAPVSSSSSVDEL